jgi:hypothetical protein
MTTMNSAETVQPENLEAPKRAGVFRPKFRDKTWAGKPPVVLLKTKAASLVPLPLSDATRHTLRVLKIHEAAEALGWTETQVRYARSLCGIWGRRNRPWTADEKAALNGAVEEAKAALPHRTPEEINRRREAEAAKVRASRKRRWLSAEEAAVLGTAPDSEVAEKLGLTVRRVRFERLARGVRKFRPTTGA